MLEVDRPDVSDTVSWKVWLPSLQYVASNVNDPWVSSMSYELGDQHPVSPSNVARVPLNNRSAYVLSDRAEPRLVL